VKLETAELHTACTLEEKRRRNRPVNTGQKGGNQSHQVNKERGLIEQAVLVLSPSSVVVIGSECQGHESDREPDRATKQIALLPALVALIGR
jgi:hypothetical protein